jgi:polyhydroxybutyrate depolymerase
MRIKSILLLIIAPVFLSCQSTDGAESRGPIKSFFIERWKKKESTPPQITELREEKIFTPGKYTLKITSAGADRYFIVHVPKSYLPKKSSSLIMALHGGGGDMNIQYNQKFYQLVSASEKFGFIVTFPNGQSPVASGKLATWNAGRCCGDGRDLDVPHVNILRDIVARIKVLLNVDPAMVFAIGMSNGGMMSYRLACEASDVFKGIASVAGTDVTTHCTPSRAISVLHIHAKDDEHVLFTGGMGKEAFRDPKKVTEFTSVPDTIAKWIQINSCKGAPQRILKTTGAYCDRYENCKNGTKVQLCVTDKGGHSWPGGVKPRTGETGSTALDANAVIWEFFKSLR